MSLRIRFRGGPLAGKIFDFGDDVEQIVIGRDPERCDLVLPSDMTEVGREHMALRRSLARYRLVLNRDNLVLVDGEPALDDTELPEVAEVRLGRDGPQLVVQTLGSVAVPPTMHQVERPQGIQDIVVETARRTRKNRLGGALVLVGLLLLGAAIVYVSVTTGQQVATVAEETARVRVLLDEESVAIEELTAEYRGNTQTLRDRLEGVDDSVKRLTPDLSSLREAVAGIGPRMAGIEERVQRLKPRMKQVLKVGAPSTYVVVLRDARGVAHAIATAWVTEGGRLATNAHVGEFFARTQPGGSMAGSSLLVRSPGDASRDHEVTQAVLHPGYQAFLDLWREHRPTGMSPEGRLHSLRPAGAACDVALFEVTDPDQLAPPLPMAPREVLEALQAGDVVGLVGYPSEDLSLGGVNLQEPTPTTQIANVTAVTNFFLASSTPDDRLLVQHALPVTGGASGSPIFNDQGQVVAVLSAGNIEVNPLGNRAPSAVQVNFAQRVDLVRELVEDRAAEAQTPRTERWRRGISTLMSLKAAAEKGALGFLKRYLEVLKGAEGTEPELVEEWTEAVDTAVPGRPWGGVHERLFTIDAKGVYVFYVFAVLGQDVDLTVLHETDDAQVYGRETSNDWYSAVRLSADGPAKVRLVVTGPRDTEYRAYAYKFAP